MPPGRTPMSEIVARPLPVIAGREPETVYVPASLDELRPILRAPGNQALVPLGRANAASIWAARPTARSRC